MTAIIKRERMAGHTHNFRNDNHLSGRAKAG
ncbi:hypothetical protein T4B_14047 [Trichinella pseudospiralis]|uniref:Uncharacterized protein n=1 Tax=Trichinella pseudospiralis TaxID=6337 RepID=A0A0V1GC08_TRIPS|nr:hypothetical protein T4A_3272 [Trichinella pseudospiralis]KRY95815.1 hypothetical protein T4B_14047 [Trichinella pseudospiralis]